MDVPVTIEAAVLDRYERFSLYNSPYPAHDRGHAIDLYPDGTTIARSPVAGTVIDTLSVGCPDRPYAVEQDHLIVIDVTGGVDVSAAKNGVGQPDDGPNEGVIARILHVDPTVDPGDRVSIGDPLGDLVRSGFFGRWVDNHLHLEFRPAAGNYYRASGAIPLEVDVSVEPIVWDGTGTVLEVGPTHALLDSPTHPNPGSFAAIACDDGYPLDGGLVHYGGGGVLSSSVVEPDASFAVEPDGSTRTHTLFGTRIGRSEGRHLRWSPIDVLANGEPITGLSLFCSQIEWGAKLVTIERSFSVGDRIELSIEPTDDPIRLGGRDEDG